MGFPFSKGDIPDCRTKRSQGKIREPDSTTNVTCSSGTNRSVEVSDVSQLGLEHLKQKVLRYRYGYRLVNGSQEW
jgi:hypothetical protein